MSRHLDDIVVDALNHKVLNIVVFDSFVKPILLNYTLKSTYIISLGLNLIISL